MHISLVGRHQTENAAVALEAVRELRKLGVQISDQAVRSGLERAVWPGRFTVLEGGHNLGESEERCGDTLLQDELTVIVDGAHNEDAAKRLAENVKELLADKKIIGIAGIFKDKEYEKIVEKIAPYLAGAEVIDLPNRERTLPKEELREVFQRYGVETDMAESIPDAVRSAKKAAGKDGVVLAFGSLSYLGEIIRLEEKEGE